MRPKRARTITFYEKRYALTRAVLRACESRGVNLDDPEAVYNDQAIGRPGPKQDLSKLWTLVQEKASQDDLDPEQMTEQQAIEALRRLGKNIKALAKFSD